MFTSIHSFKFGRGFVNPFISPGVNVVEMDTDHIDLERLRLEELRLRYENYRYQFGGGEPISNEASLIIRDIINDI